MTTAKAILARAIEILDDIDNGSVQPVLAVAKPTWPSRPFLVRKWRSTRRVGYTCRLAHCRWKTTQKMYLWSDGGATRPSREFVGPMPGRSSKHHTEWLCRRRHRQLCRPDAIRSSRRWQVRWRKSHRLNLSVRCRLFLLSRLPRKSGEACSSASLSVQCLPFSRPHRSPEGGRERPSVEFVGPMPAIPVVLIQLKRRKPVHRLNLRSDARHGRRRTIGVRGAPQPRG